MGAYRSLLSDLIVKEQVDSGVSGQLNLKKHPVNESTPTLAYQVYNVSALNVNGKVALPPVIFSLPMGGFA